MPHKENVVIINFTDRKVLTTGTVLPRNPRWWQGEIEPQVTHVLADDSRIVDAYARVGVPRYEENSNIRIVSSKYIELPENLDLLPWHKLRSLACFLAPDGVKIKDKDTALEVINASL